MKECKFCRIYDSAKQINNRFNDESNGRFKTKYFAQLVEMDWDTINEQYTGRVGHEKVALKYCPLCGKKL